MKVPRLDLNPSSADRWTTCTASPGFILANADKIPSQDTSYSQEGTSAHEVASAYLLGRKPRVNDPYYCPVPVDCDMRWHGWNYSDYILSLAEETGNVFVEQKLPLWYMESRNAIVDAVITNEANIHIVDYKYGQGVIVLPEYNLQMIIYSRSVIRKYAVHIGLDFPVSLHIYQPRAQNSDSPFSVWQTTWGEIKELSEALITDAATRIKAHQEKVLAIESVKPLAFYPSEKTCRWCPAKGFCPARQETLTKGIQELQIIEPGPKHLPPVKAVSLKQLAAIVEHKTDLVKWINDAYEYALQFVQGGGKLPGFKLALSRGGHRYWTNEVEAAKRLLEATILKEEEVWKKKVISPSEAETLIGKNKFTGPLMNLIGKPPGKPILVPEDDERESITVDPTSEFEKLTE